VLAAKVIASIQDTSVHEIILRTFVRYACRLCSGSSVRQLTGVLDPTERHRISELKEWFDGDNRNNLYRALWHVPRTRPYRYDLPEQRPFSPHELKGYFELLTPSDVSTLRRTEKPAAYTNQQIRDVLENKGIRKRINDLVRRRLWFVFNNDGGITEEDLCGELRCQAVKIIRNYEVQGVSVTGMCALVARGMEHFTTNLAVKYGKEQRNPLRRVVVQRDYRRAWYCNTADAVVDLVMVATHKKYRKGRLAFAILKRDRSKRFIDVYRLYETEQEATTALQNYQAFGEGPRQCCIDLSPRKQNDWQPTCASLDKPTKEDGSPLYAFIPANDEVSEYDEEIDKTLRKFLDSTLRSDLQFHNFCTEKTGRTPAELTPKLLYRTAKQFYTAVV